MDIYGFYGIFEFVKWDVGIYICYSRIRVDNVVFSFMFKVFNSSGDLDVLLEVNLGGVIFDEFIGDISSVGLCFRFVLIIIDLKFVLNGGFVIKMVMGEEKVW